MSCPMRMGRSYRDTDGYITLRICRRSQLKKDVKNGNHIHHWQQGICVDYGLTKYPFHLYKDLEGMR